MLSLSLAPRCFSLHLPLFPQLATFSLELILFKFIYLCGTLPLVCTEMGDQPRDWGDEFSPDGAWAFRGQG